MSGAYPKQWNGYLELVPQTLVTQDLLIDGGLHRNPMGDPRRGWRIKALVSEHYGRSRPTDESA